MENEARVEFENFFKISINFYPKSFSIMLQVILLKGPMFELNLDNIGLIISVIPGVGLIIMSTSNLLNALSSELSNLIKQDADHLSEIIEKKIFQLTLLNRALVCLYIGASSFIAASLLVEATLSFPKLAGYAAIFLVVGTIATLIALFLLIAYSSRAVSIKRQQFFRALAKQKPHLSRVKRLANK